MWLRKSFWTHAGVLGAGGAYTIASWVLGNFRSWHPIASAFPPFSQRTRYIHPSQPKPIVWTFLRCSIVWTSRPVSLCSFAIYTYLGACHYTTVRWSIHCFQSPPRQINPYRHCRKENQQSMHMAFTTCMCDHLEDGIMSDHTQTMGRRSWWIFSSFGERKNAATIDEAIRDREVDSMEFPNVPMANAQVCSLSCTVAMYGWGIMCHRRIETYFVASRTW